MVIINSYHQGYDWSDKELSGFLERLRQTYPGITPPIEHLDAKRHPTQEQKERMRRYLAEKYRGQKVDLVITLDNAALDLALDYREELFPGAPLVFASVNNFTPAMLKGQKKVTGLGEVLDLGGTLELALSLHPGAKEVLVMHDFTDTGLALRRRMEGLLPQFAGRVQVSFTPPASFREVLDRVKSLPPGSLGLITGYTTDLRGVSLSLAEGTRLLSRAAVPVYGLHETRLGYGIVGGILLEGREYGRRAGDMALRVLGGEDPSRIPVYTKSIAQPMFDYRQLQRFHISLKDLPPGSKIINRPEYFYSKNKSLVQWVAAVIIFLTVVVVILSSTVIRRRRAEERLRESEEKFRLLVENANEIILVAQGDRIRFANPVATENSGYSLEELTSRPFLEFVHPDDREMTVKLYNDRLKGLEVPDVFYCRYFAKDGGLHWAEIKTSDITWEGEQAVLTCLSDITERKEAEEALQTRHGELQTLHRLSEIAIGEKSIQEALPLIAEEVSKATGYPLVAVERYHPERQTMEFLALTGGAGPIQTLPFEMPVAENLAGKVILTGQAVVESHALLRLEISPEASPPLEVKTFIAVPMLGKEGILGALSLAHPESLAVDERFLNWIRSLANYLAVLMEHRQGQEDLSRRNAEFEAIFNSLSDGVIYTDHQCRIIMANQAACRLWDYELAEMVGRSTEFLYVNQEDFEEQRRMGFPAGVETSQKIWEFSYRRRDGSTFPGESLITQVRDARDNYLGFVSIHRDVTARREAERQILRLATFPELNPNLVLEVDEHGQILYANPAAMETAQRLGLSGGVRAFLPRNLEDLFVASRQGGDRHVVFDLTLPGASFEVHVSLPPRLNTARLYAVDITERDRAEEALKESEERYRTVADFTHDMEYWIGPDQNIIYMSPSCEGLTGYTREEFFREPDLLAEIVHPEDRSLFDAHSQETKACPYHLDLDFRLIRRDGEEIWISHACQPVFGLDGRPLGRRVSNRDITGRKKAERDLQEIFQFNREIIAGAGEGIIVYDRQFRYKLWNKFMEEMTGSRADEVLNQNALELFPHLREQNVEDLLKRALAGETVTSPDVPFFVPQTGRSGWVVGTYAPHRNLDGEIVGVIATVRDVTQRRQAEEEVREGMRLNQLFLDGLPFVAMLIRPYSLEIVAANEAAAQLGAVPGAYCHAIFGQGQEACPFCLAPQVWEDGQTQSLEAEALGRVWEVHWIALQKDLFLHYAFDITDRKKAEKAQKILESQLFQSQKMEALGTLAGGIAHDFNNILGAMLGFAELAAFELPEGSKGETYLENLLKAGDRARNLVKQILSFSRKEKMIRRPLFITPIVKETLKFLRASIPTTIEIRTHLHAGKAMVMADPTQIHQILLNLATNAVHAMEDKGGLLEIGLKLITLSPEEPSPYKGMPPGSYLELSVRDTGLGMEPEVLERIFEPFFTTKEPGKGTGMGLAVAYGAVISLDGTIQVDSHPGWGTTFQVLLPLAKEELEEREPEVMMPQPGFKGSGRILFVDDDVDFFPAGRQMLMGLGYEVVGLTNSFQALKEFRSHPERFDLIISDQTMPGLTGLELAAACSQLRPDIPIILCTGFSESVTEEKIRSAGVWEVVAKPFDLHQISEVIQKSLKEKKDKV